MKININWLASMLSTFLSHGALTSKFFHSLENRFSFDFHFHSVSRRAVKQFDITEKKALKKRKEKS
jgi:hypothetical protein